MRAALIVLSLAIVPLPGCSALGSSPMGVVEDLGDYAEKRKLVHFRKLFSTGSVETLQRRWREDGVSPAEGWLDLMIGYLGADRKQPEVIGEELKGEKEAVVKVSKEMKKQKKVIVQDIMLVKEGDEWRIDIGEMIYVEEDTETGEKKKKKDLPPLGADEGDEDDWGLSDEQGKKKGRKEDLEDFDLEDF